MPFGHSNSMLCLAPCTGIHAWVQHSCECAGMHEQSQELSWRLQLGLWRQRAEQSGWRCMPCTANDLLAAET
eukprot:11313111-Alexandrium_andersonii.AAC.1